MSTFMFKFDRSFFENVSPDQAVPSITIAVTPQPDWDNFVECAEQLIAELGGVVKAEDYGMDRHQFDFERNGSRYLLQYEHVIA